MIILLFGITAVAAVAAVIGYVKWKICAHAALAYFAAKGYKLPDDEDQKKYYEYAVRKLLRLPAKLP